MATKKRSRGRPRKDVIIKDNDITETAGIPGLLQPTEYDLMDELSRLDSFSYGSNHDEL